MCSFDVNKTIFCDGRTVRKKDEIYPHNEYEWKVGREAK
jgi:hypothetical protein